MQALIDTHCHLDTHYVPDPAAVMARAREAGVGGFVVIGVGAELTAAREAGALSARMPRTVAAVVGLHPHDASAMDDAMFAELAELSRRPEVVAVGEIGLDYHYDHSPRGLQRDAFARLIALAREVGKPIVVHTREAAADTLALLESESARDVGGIIHCFSEDMAFAERAWNLDFDVSFSGIVTFKSARAVHEVAANAPIARVHVETDSPYLAPVPMRGKPCEPAFVAYTAKRVAELRGISLEALAEAAHENAERRFSRSFE